jgi:acetylglutamate kinase
MLVLKVGGNEIDDTAFVDQLGEAMAAVSQPMMLVHGGGKEIKQLQEKLGLEAQYIDGLRVTDEESLVLVQMVLAGRINKRLVATLSNAGLDVFGMSGIDRTSIQAKKLIHPNGDLGFVGQVTQVKTDVFKRMLEDQVIPVISPICYGPGGDVFNVNADHVAQALAVAMRADELVFLTIGAAALVFGLSSAFAFVSALGFVSAFGFVSVFGAGLVSVSAFAAARLAGFLPSVRISVIRSTVTDCLCPFVRW